MICELRPPFCEQPQGRAATAEAGKWSMDTAANASNSTKACCSRLHTQCLFIVFCLPLSVDAVVFLRLPHQLHRIMGIFRRSADHSPALLIRHTPIRTSVGPHRASFSTPPSPAASVGANFGFPRRPPRRRSLPSSRHALPPTCSSVRPPCGVSTGKGDQDSPVMRRLQQRQLETPQPIISSCSEKGLLLLL
ncbi:hypothetical protein FHG87_004123 [Trinorchestia longiramus]|nr:hypothetical protein FHG87_004123 [Trinorchestia longiramus]